MTDQKMADAVEATLRGDKRCRACGAWDAYQSHRPPMCQACYEFMPRGMTIFEYIQRAKAARELGWAK